MWVKTNGDIWWRFLPAASAKIPGRDESILPFDFYGQLPDYYSHVLAVSKYRI